MTLGAMATDCEVRVDYDRLRRERLRKVNGQLKKDKLGSLLCFDLDAIRYITSTRLNDWTNNKLARSCLLAADREPILFEIGGAIETKKTLCPWMEDRIRPFIGSMRGSFPSAVVMENARKFAGMIAASLKEFAVDGEPVGSDFVEFPLLRALEDEGLRIVDGQQTLLNSQLIKIPEEIALVETSVSIVEAAF